MKFLVFLCMCSDLCDFNSSNGREVKKQFVVLTLGGTELMRTNRGLLVDKRWDRKFAPWDFRADLGAVILKGSTCDRRSSFLG